MNYDLTQFLSGHGGYRSYLYRFKLDSSPRCPECPNEDETAEHVVFKCPRFNNIRREIEAFIGETLSVTNVITVMLQSESYWNALNHYISNVHNTLQMAERSRKAEMAALSLVMTQN